MLKSIKLLFLTVMMAVLTACGGGGGENPSVDKVPPVITVLGEDPVKITVNEMYTDAGARAVDDKDGIVAVVTTGSVDTTIVGTYQIEYSAKDSAGNRATQTRTVHVVLSPDETAPVISILGENPANLTVNGVYTDAGAKAVDDRDGNVAVVTTGSVDTETVGTYLIEYSTEDSAGNHAHKSRTVHVLPPDVIAPIIAILGENPTTVFQGGSYVDAGATATDNRDSMVTVVNTGNVDTTTIGVYVIAYDAADSAGNDAQTEIRTVNVIQAPDTSAPVITVLGDNPLNVEINSTYTDAGAEAVDDRDGNVPVTVTGTVNTSTLGTYIIAYSATDSVGNTATKTRTVHVLPPDTTPPVISIIGENPVTVDVNETYVDEGARAVDERDGDVPVQTTGSVDTSIEGTYIITYTARDSADNSSTKTRTVIVAEMVNQAPVANAGMNIVSKEGSLFVLDASASSDDEGIVSYKWFKGLVELGEGKSLELNATDFGIGKYSVLLRVEDDEGLQDTDMVQIDILYSVKKTGQSKSFNEDGVEIEDSSLKDDGYYQKGISPHYTRDDENGTVLDHISGLMWQDNARVNKVWLESEKYDVCRNDTGSVACFDTSGDTAETYCTDLNLSGYENWRVPSVTELQRIIYYDNRNPAVHTVFTHTTVGYHWTATSVTNHEEYGWVINFEYGDANGYLKAAQLSIRCVRDTKLK